MLCATVVIYVLVVFFNNNGMSHFKIHVVFTGRDACFAITYHIRPNRILNYFSVRVAVNMAGNGNGSSGAGGCCSIYCLCVNVYCIIATG